MPVVVGLFDSQNHAENSIAGLVRAGYDRSDISLVAPGGAEVTQHPGENLNPSKNISASGPVNAALATGAAGGGVAGALVGQGLAEEEAEYYQEGLRRGGTLVAVRCHMLAMGMAANVMRRSEAVDVSCRVMEIDGGKRHKEQMAQKGEERRRAEKSGERSPKVEDKTRKMPE
jgi:hypothetical protein